MPSQAPPFARSWHFSLAVDDGSRSKRNIARLVASPIAGHPYNVDMTTDRADTGVDVPSDRTLAILDDLWRGERPPVVAKRHGVSLQWVHILRKRAGIPVPPRPPRTRRPPKVQVPKPPRPLSPRTVAIIADVQAGMLYREVGARHGVGRHTVFRIAVVGVRAPASAGTATAFLNELVTRMPFPVQAIQVDGGSEFMAGSEAACEERGIALSVLPPRSPKLNGRVERLNDTARREFWECYDGELDLPTLQAALLAWEATYHTVRPHQALGYDTPQEFLRSKKFSDVSN